MTQVVIIGVLVLLLCAGGVTLLLDARQRRLNRQIALALRTSQSEGLLSVRRQQTMSRWHLLHLFANYKEGLVYAWPPRYVVIAGFVTVAAIFYGNSRLEFPIGYVSVLAIIAGIVVVRGLFGWQQRQVIAKLFRQFPDAIELITSTVRSGLPVTEAFQIIARDMPQPTAGQFTIICHDIGLGKAPEESLDAVAQRIGVAEYGMLGVTLAVQSKSGGRLSETLQTLGETVRQRVAMAGRAKAMAGEVIFSSRALSLAPLVVGGLLYWISPETVDLLFSDPTGRKMLAYAVGSVITGTLVLRWMVRRGTAL
jgi:tight adherence protein B